MKTRLESVEIAVDGDSVSGTLLAPATALPGVLFVHGWGGSQEQDLERAREAAGLGCVCVTFDLRGHERSARLRESVSREQNLRDVVAAYDWLAQQRNVEPAAIAVVGTSYGGYLAAILSSLRAVRWLALRAPALYKDEDWHLPKRQLHADLELRAYRHRCLSWQQNRALGACAKFQGDALIIESEHDQLVPHQVIENYVTAFTKTKSITSRMLSGADHALSEPTAQQGYTALLMKWLTEMVVGARADAVESEVANRRSERPDPG